MPPPLKIKIYLDKTDSRFQDYKKEFLDRITMIKDIEIEFAHGKELEENYGLITYALKVKGHWLTESTYSNSLEEAFQILSKLSGVSFHTGYNPYPGYPLVVAKEKLISLKYLYYVGLPFLFLLAYPLSNRRIRYGKNG